MTKLDLFIRTSILKRLHILENTLDEGQLVQLHRMIHDIYQDQRLVFLDVEQRIEIVITRYSLI